MFPASIGNLLLVGQEKVTLFNIQSRKETASIVTGASGQVRFAYWTPNHKRLALMSKTVIVICDGKLRELCRISESKLKSGVWAPSGVFIYTTPNRIKYCLP